LVVLVSMLAVLAVSCGAAETVESQPAEGNGSTIASVATTRAAPSSVGSEPVAISPVGVEQGTTEESTPPATPTASVGDVPVTTVPVTTVPPKEEIVIPEPVAPNAAGPVAATVTDLARRLGVDASLVTVVSVDDVTWPDGSIGCPQPGMSYTQALVNGSLIVLEVDSIQYEYHSADGGDPFYCPTPTPPAPAGYGDK
jgi:hypothetical protein